MLSDVLVASTPASDDLPDGLPLPHSSLAVRITDDHYRHSECYTCTDCGLNLMMRGHFWFGDTMYCEKHAKERHLGKASSPQATVYDRQ